MAPSPKLSADDIERIRRRVQAGEHQTDLAREFGVDRKTVRRRLDALERSEIERGARLAAKRVRRQAAREKRKLLERESDSAPLIKQTQSSERATKRRAEFDPFLEWLDTPKNLSGQAHAEASGLVRLCSPDNTRRRWVERSDVERLFDDGWRLYEK